MATRTRRARIDWKGHTLQRAARIAREQEEATGRAITLRRLHYLLVAAAAREGFTYFNDANAYNRLSPYTAQARREGWFPRLAEEGRSVDVAESWPSVAAHLSDAADR